MKTAFLYVKEFFIRLLRLRRNARLEFSDRTEVYDKHGKRHVYPWEGASFNTLTEKTRSAFVPETEEEEFDPALSAMNPLSDAARTFEGPGVVFKDSPFGKRKGITKIARKP